MADSVRWFSQSDCSICIILGVSKKVIILHSGSLSPSKTGEKDHAEKLTFAKKSCPKELELCPSSIGFKHGIRTKQVIPEGTWMGPYQGELMKASDITADADTSYMWEVTKELEHFTHTHLTPTNHVKEMEISLRNHCKPYGK